MTDSSYDRSGALCTSDMTFLGLPPSVYDKSETVSVEQQSIEQCPSPRQREFLRGDSDTSGDSTTVYLTTNGEKSQVVSSPRLSVLSRNLSRHMSTVFDRRSPTDATDELDEEDVAAVNNTVCDLKFNGNNQIFVETQPKKVTIDDINDDRVLAKLRAFSRKEHTEECFDFLESVVCYRKNPTYERASYIVATFIKPSAPHSVNICYDVRHQIIETVSHQPFDATSQVTVFDEAFEEITELVKQDILVRYNNSHLSHKTIIRPSRFRKIMIGITVANIVCFVLLAGLVFFTYIYLYTTTSDTTRASNLVGQIHESNSVARLMIRAVAYGGNDMYLTGYGQQIELLQAELNELQTLDSKYTLSPAGVLANQQLLDMESQIIYWRIDQNNRTAALDILLSQNYNDTYKVVMASITSLQKKVLNDSDTQNSIVYVSSIAGMVIVALALVYSIPSAVYLVVHERRHTRQMLKLTQMLDSTLKDASSGSPQHSTRSRNNSNLV